MVFGTASLRPVLCVLNDGFASRSGIFFRPHLPATVFPRELRCELCLRKSNANQQGESVVRHVTSAPLAVVIGALWDGIQVLFDVLSQSCQPFPELVDLPRAPIWHRPLLCDTLL